MRAKGVKISHEGVAGVLRGAPPAPETRRDEPMKALANNPRCVVIKPSGKGFIIGGQR